ncbi:MAG: cytidine deaminase [Bacteroidia bacterium]|nr:cytidine deaminase [Bacteroidia bacterium]MCZ2276903.1 cytidine deaminase [Bacteroidia bacterium]
MTEKELTIKFEQYDCLEGLPAPDAHLMGEAIDASKTAYAPYSKFRVGAALLLEDGTIIKGSNQENAAYPSGLCAERVAFFSAGSNYPDKKIIAVAVAAFQNDEVSLHPASPCGDCRQVMAEFECRFQSPIRIIMMVKKNEFLVADRVSWLLPFLFSSDNLRSDLK